MPRKARTFDQAFAVLQGIRNSGIGADGLQDLLDGGYLSDLFQANKSRKLPRRNLFRKALGLRPVDLFFRMTIDYTKTEKDLILGSPLALEWKDIPHVPQVNGVMDVVVRLKYLNLGFSGTVNEIIRLEFLSGWHPAGLHELAAIVGHHGDSLDPDYDIFATVYKPTFIRYTGGTMRVHELPHWFNTPILNEKTDSFLFVKRQPK